MKKARKTKTPTVQFVEAQITEVGKIRKELIDVGTVTLSVSEHYTLIDHLAATLIATKWLLKEKNI